MVKSSLSSGLSISSKTVDAVPQRSSHGVRAREHLLKALQLDPSLADAYTGVGLYNYYVDTLSALAKMLRFFMGIPGGSKRDGVRQLEKAMTEGEITSGCNFHGNNILIGAHDSTLYCLSPEGKKLWDVRTDGPVNGSPVVIGDSVLYCAGRIWGRRLLDIGFIRRHFVPLDKQEKIEKKFACKDLK